MSGLGGRYFVLDSGDGQAPVPEGRYYRVEVNRLMIDPAGSARVSPIPLWKCHPIRGEQLRQQPGASSGLIAASGPSDLKIPDRLCRRHEGQQVVNRGQQVVVCPTILGALLIR
jgi:hypothetical protein